MHRPHFASCLLPMYSLRYLKKRQPKSWYEYVDELENTLTCGGRENGYGCGCCRGRAPAPVPCHRATATARAGGRAGSGSRCGSGGGSGSGCGSGCESGCRDRCFPARHTHAIQEVMATIRFGRRQKRAPQGRRTMCFSMLFSCKGTWVMAKKPRVVEAESAAGLKDGVSMRELKLWGSTKVVESYMLGCKASCMLTKPSPS